MENEFEKYLEKRNNAITGLFETGFDTILPATIEQWLKEQGFQIINSQYFSSEKEDHEFHEYLKGDLKIVIIQTYIEKEGGLHYETIYSNGEFAKVL